jgi:hypothetical protein
MGSYIVVTERLEPAVANRLIPKGRMIIDTKHVLYYFRRTADDDGTRMSARENCCEHAPEYNVQRLGRISSNSSVSATLDDRRPLKSVDYNVDDNAGRPGSGSGI